MLQKFLSCIMHIYVSILVSNRLLRSCYLWSAWFVASFLFLSPTTDTIDTERYTVVLQKYLNITAPNMAAIQGDT